MEPVITSSSSVTATREDSETTNSKHHHRHHRPHKSSRHSRSRSRSKDESLNRHHHHHSSSRHHRHRHRHHEEPRTSTSKHHHHHRHQHKPRKDQSNSSESSESDIQPRSTKDNVKEQSTNLSIPSALPSSSSSSSVIPGTIQPPSVLLTTDDFASKAVEFRYWLWYHYKHTRLFDLPKITAQEIFAEYFIPQWNKGLLTDIYTVSTAKLLDKLEGTSRTEHKWTFAKKINEQEQIQLDTINDTVLKQTLTASTIQTEEKDTSKKRIPNNYNTGSTNNGTYRG